MTWELPGGRRLVLAGGGLGWFWLLSGLAALALLLVLYREERRLVSRRAGLGLLALRGLAASALVTALFEPIAARTTREVARGRVVLAVDVSESMATTDPSRTGSERARLLGTLGMGPDGAIDAMPRREVARRLLTDGGALRGLDADHEIEGLTFARETAATSFAGLADALKPSKPGDAASALGTDWQPALAEGLKATAGQAPVVGVVLVTDGRRNAAGDPASTVDRLAAGRGVPVYPVLVGSTRPPKDAAVARLKVPESVYLGDVATVEATLKLDGYAGEEVVVTLDRPGGSPLRQVVRASGDGARPVLTFRVPMEEVGAVPLTAAVGPLAGDVRPDNDRKTAVVAVADDKARVLLVDGEARWEFQYLRNALARDPRVSVEAIVYRQPGTSAGSGFTYGTSLPSASASTGDPLAGFDVVIVGDVDPSEGSGEFWNRLDAFVAGRGGTLVVCPGPRFGPALSAEPRAKALLPVMDPRVVTGGAPDPSNPALPAGVRFEPTEGASADAGSWPMLQLASDAESSRKRWAGLPGLPWLLAGKAKPGATPLATAGDDPESVVLAAQPYGLGKVLWVGTDGTWRWRYRVGDADHHRFWGQVVRWASAGKLAAGNALVRFGPLRPRAPEGEAVKVEARIAEGVEGVGPDLLIAARVVKAGTDEAVAVVPLRAAQGRPRVYEGVCPALPIGSYAMRLDAPGLAEALQLEPTPPTPRPTATLDVVSRDDAERVELAADRDPLDRLASATGGKVFADYEAGDLPKLLKASRKETVRTEETPLWDTPAALLLFFAIVTAEWIGRKMAGLP